uniref:Uncharacterized protein n=1 Tax=Lobelia erinus TaxID=16430 RepID=A0A291F6A6_LOBER|nr:hypothetical protein Lo_eri1Pt0342 [Lobelia erinus]ATG27666.1 hypothetical protein Lo_eri1Pt0342 [Lobelia erinus]
MDRDRIFWIIRTTMGVFFPLVVDAFNFLGAVLARKKPPTRKFLFSFYVDVCNFLGAMLSPMRVIRPPRKSQYSDADFVRLDLDASVYKMLWQLDLTPLVERIVRRVDFQYHQHGDETVEEEVCYVAFKEGIRYGNRRRHLFRRTEKMFRTAEIAASVRQLEACQKAKQTLQTKALTFFWGGVLFSLRT